MKNVDGKPMHYQLFPDMEAIAVIREVLTVDEYIGYLKGNILKYRLRAGKKGDALTDLNKAEDYEIELQELNW
jgi:hypothetical protein